MSKRRPKQLLEAPPASIEDALQIVRKVVTRYLDPTVTERSEYHPKPHVIWELGLTTEDDGDRYFLRFRASYEKACMVMDYRAYEVRFGCIASVEETLVTRALFHALSWSGSPFWFAETGVWRRKSYIYG